jgi:hypothetical protein
MIDYGNIESYSYLESVKFVADTCVNYNPLIKMIFMQIRTILIRY